jgi:hypothetical protein
MRSIAHNWRQTALAGGAVLVLAGSTVGVVAAQSTPTPVPGQQSQKAQRPDFQAYLDALAKRLNITTATLQQAMRDARTDVGLPPDGPGGGPGFGRGPGGRGPSGPRGFGPGGDLSATAQAIGISADQLRQELPGKSLAQVAQAHGKTASDVATALKNAANQRIDQEVSGGRLTADQATQRKQDLAQRIDQLVNEVRPTPPARPGANGAPAS